MLHSPILKTAKFNVVKLHMFQKDVPFPPKKEKGSRRFSLMLSPNGENRSTHTHKKKKPARTTERKRKEEQQKGGWRRRGRDGGLHKPMQFPAGKRKRKCGKGKRVTEGWSLCATHTQKGHREKGMEKKKILPQVVSSTYGGGRESEGEKRVS